MLMFDKATFSIKEINVQIMLGRTGANLLYKQGLLNLVLNTNREIDISAEHFTYQVDLDGLKMFVNYDSQ